MVRKTEREQLDRLTVKTLDQVFIARAKEGLNCSSFEAQALTDLVISADGNTGYLATVGDGQVIVVVQPFQNPRLLCKNSIVKVL